MSLLAQADEVSRDTPVGGELPPVFIHDQSSGNLVAEIGGDRLVIPGRFPDFDLDRLVTAFQTASRETAGVAGWPVNRAIELDSRRVCQSLGLNKDLNKYGRFIVYERQDFKDGTFGSIKRQLRFVLPSDLEWARQQADWLQPQIKDLFTVLGLGPENLEVHLIGSLNADAFVRTGLVFDSRGQLVDQAGQGSDIDFLVLVKGIIPKSVTDLAEPDYPFHRPELDYLQDRFPGLVRYLSTGEVNVIVQAGRETGGSGLPVVLSGEKFISKGIRESDEEEAAFDGWVVPAEALARLPVRGQINHLEAIVYRAALGDPKIRNQETARAQSLSRQLAEQITDPTQVIDILDMVGNQFQLFMIMNEQGQTTETDRQINSLLEIVLSDFNNRLLVLDKNQWVEVALFELFSWEQLRILGNDIGQWQELVGVIAEAIPAECSNHQQALSQIESVAWRLLFVRQVEVLAADFTAGDESNKRANALIQVSQVVDAVRDEGIDDAFDFVDNQINPLSVAAEITYQQRLRLEFLTNVREQLLDHCFSLGEAGISLLTGRIVPELTLGSKRQERTVIYDNLDEVQGLIREAIKRSQSYQQALALSRDGFLAWLQAHDFRTGKRPVINN